MGPWGPARVPALRPLLCCSAATPSARSSQKSAAAAGLNVIAEGRSRAQAQPEIKEAGALAFCAKGPQGQVTGGLSPIASSSLPFSAACLHSECKDCECGFSLAFWWTVYGKCAW